MGFFDLLGRWPVLRQLRSGDVRGLGESARSPHGASIAPRTREVDRVVRSVCPYCAVGCGQRVHVKDDKIVAIEGDPDSPISEGTFCPKGVASYQLVTGSHRPRQVLYRRPFGTEWEAIPLEQAMEMVAQRVKRSRDETWESHADDGTPLNRTLGIASLGGATLDNEENYLIKKLFSGLGIVQVENQARI